MTTEKKFGKYDGGIFEDPSCVTTCTEQTLYFLINTFGDIIWRLNHDMAHGKTEEKFDLMPYQYALEFCVMHTPRFGVTIAEPKEGEHVKATDSYWAWFRWWNTYFQKTLTNQEYKEYVTKSQKGEDVSHFRPAGDWRDNI